MGGWIATHLVYTIALQTSHDILIGLLGCQFRKNGLRYRDRPEADATTIAELSRN